MGACQHGNEVLGSIKWGFHEWPSDLASQGGLNSMELDCRLVSSDSPNLHGLTFWEEFHTFPPEQLSFQQGLRLSPCKNIKSSTSVPDLTAVAMSMIYIHFLHTHIR
jgi:hypothetical protein